jgi:hypothetical protein
MPVQPVTGAHEAIRRWRDKSGHATLRLIGRRALLFEALAALRVELAAPTVVPALAIAIDEVDALGRRLETWLPVVRLLVREMMIVDAAVSFTERQKALNVWSGGVVGDVAPNASGEAPSARWTRLARALAHKAR